MQHWFWTGAASGSVVTYENWNELVNHCYMSSTGYWGVSAQVVELNDWMANSGANYTSAYDSGQIAMYKIIHADDLNSWDSATWHNSSLIWDDTNQVWKAYKSGAGGTTDHGALDGLTDDDHTQYYNATRLDSYTSVMSGNSLSGQRAEHWIINTFSGNADARYVASGVTLLSISSQNISGGTLSLNSDTLIDTPRSGQFLQYKQNNARWENELAPITYSVANIRLLSGQNINLARFTCPADTKCYVWQCSIANSGGACTGDLYIEVLSGNTQTAGAWSSIYKTSSATVERGYPLGVSAVDSMIEIRAMYSSQSGYGSEIHQLEYCTAFAQVSLN